MHAAADRAAFIRAHTRIRPVPLVPEISLHLADEAVPLWQKTEDELATIGLPPPFWAFAWAGGQALARFLLDHPGEVAGRRVLDLGAGSGLVAIAAAKAGAASASAADIDGFAESAIALNAAVNGVRIGYLGDDLPAGRASNAYDTVLVGDLFYERGTAERVLAFLQACAAAGSRVLIGDPGRAYLPKASLTKLAEYSVPVTRDLEDNEIKHTAVFALIF